MVGPALIGFGYGVSWLALRLSGGAQKVMAEMADMKDPGAMKDPGMTSGSFDMPVGGELWGPDAWWLLAAEPHTGSTFDLIGSIGIAITVLLCLTLYVAHILVILALPGEAATPPQSASAALLLWFIVGATLFAAIWSRFFRRGPLEYLLNGATKVANFVR